jgi:hypothetical protein
MLVVGYAPRTFSGLIYRKNLKMVRGAYPYRALAEQRKVSRRLGRDPDSINRRASDTFMWCRDWAWKCWASYLRPTLYDQN